MKKRLMEKINTEPALVKILSSVKGYKLNTDYNYVSVFAEGGGGGGGSNDGGGGGSGYVYFQKNIVISSDATIDIVIGSGGGINSQGGTTCISGLISATCEGGKPGTCSGWAIGGDGASGGGSRIDFGGAGGGSSSSAIQHSTYVHTPGQGGDGTFGYLGTHVRSSGKGTAWATVIPLTSIFGGSGKGGERLFDGGAGAGGGGAGGCDGGKDGGDGVPYNNDPSIDNPHRGIGQGHTTRDFGEPTGTPNAAGSKGDAAPNADKGSYAEGSGTNNPNSGYGGAGDSSDGNRPGGDGTVLIRYWAYEE